MIGESWMDDPARLWRFRLSRLHVKEKRHDCGITIERISDNRFAATRNGVRFVAGGGNYRADSAIDRCLHFILTGDTSGGVVTGKTA